MKIRFLLHDLYGRGGGVVTVTLALAEELARRHEVELVSLFGDDRRPVHPLPAGVPATTLIQREVDREGGLRRGSCAWAMRRPSSIIPKAEPRYARYSLYSDLVLARYLGSMRGGALVTMQPGLNIASARLGSTRCARLAQDHRPVAKRPRGVLEGYRRHAGGLDSLLALTRSDTEHLQRLVGDRVAVHEMPNGAPNYDGPLSEHTNKTVLAAGRLSHTKGFDVLIAAWVHVAEKHPDWQLQICGEGELRSELRRQIIDLGLQRHVHLVGYRTHLQEDMSRASIFVLSSRAEGYPRVILEAMACGVPVISTDCPSGPREMISPGVDGLLVPSQDPEALGAAVNELIGLGPEPRSRMGSAGLSTARERSQSVVAERWESLLADLVEAREAPARRVLHH
ncbi:MAG: glycosyltransferase [Actinomycetota bacterium]|nr:glycosyltransferase [Actinomycetota bacterium]